MIRLQRWEGGPYFTAFSLHIPDMRVEIVKICAHSPIVSLSNTQVRQAPSARSNGNNLPSGRHAYSVASVLPIQMRLSGATGLLEFSSLQHAHRVLKQPQVILPRTSRIHVDVHDSPETVA